METRQVGQDDFWQRIADHSPFLRRAGERHPAILRNFNEGGAQAAVDAALALNAEGIGPQLRRRREALALAVALADLSGQWAMPQVTRTLSDFADLAIDRALAAAIDGRIPGAPLTGICAIALGKLGSRELNYSSDVDLILLYDPARVPRRDGQEPGDSAVRIARDFVALLQERTPEGYVARVDLRLRPASEATPIALPVDAAISHYESAALGWERAAFIRARACGGDRLLGQLFLDAVRPFVWRRALDFGVIEEIRGIAGQVRDHYHAGQAFGPGFDLKRGRGGIREIEFLAQSLQLIHGGRDETLRAPATLDALQALEAAGHVEAQEAEALAKAYGALRDAEHRLQMVADRQTHEVPRDADALDNVGRLAGCPDGEAWLAGIAPHVAAVAPRFDALVEEQGDRLPHDEATLREHLEEIGLPNPANAARLLAGWRSGKARSLRSSAARSAFEAMLPAMMQAIAAAPEPDHALNRFADIVEKVPSAINFYRLLEAEPQLAHLLATLLAHSPALTAQLARRPALLDSLLDKSVFDAVGSAAGFAARLGREIEPLDIDRALDRARATVGEKRFALGVQLIDGEVDSLEVAHGYAHVAEGAIRALADRTRREFEVQHGCLPGDGLAIVGLGRLGGEAMTHASDLDIVFLYDAPGPGAMSDGARPLSPADYYNKLANRVVAALSVPTASGPLYDVDTRLRPQGLTGALAVSFEGFEQYQRDTAWTWEHMALMRARPVWGSAAAQERVAAIIARVLGEPRDLDGVLADARIMRRDIEQHKPPAGRLDIKLGPGGLVDMEFGVHVRQLATGAARDPDLGRAIERLVEAGLAPDTLPADHALLTRLLLLFRLVAPDSASPSRAARALVAERLGVENWDALRDAHDQARTRIAQFWKETDNARGG